ncbi:MAG: FlgD immunoglobulin-like domain containing protein [Candidatus Eisenbacteria bacterium]
MQHRISKPLCLAVAVLALAFAVGTATAPAFAGQNLGCKIAIHLKAHPTSCTKSYPAFTACEGINETWVPTGDVDAMPVFYDLASYTTHEFGLTWPIEWGSGSWTRCKGDIAVGGILYSGEGTAIAWTTCQYGWGLATGYIWLAATGPGYVTPVANPATNQLDVVDCDFVTGPYQDFPILISSGGVGGLTGDEPCRVALQPITLTKGDGIASDGCAFPSANMTYTIGYTNTNGTALTHVEITDPLPAEVDYVSSTGGGSYNARTRTVTWTIGTVAGSAGGSLDLVVMVKASTAGGSSFSNTCSVVATETPSPRTVDHTTHVCACLINGPTTVCPNATSSYSGPVGMQSYQWSVTGSGTLQSPPSGQSVNVKTSGGCGVTYTVHLTVVDAAGFSSTCEKTATTSDTIAPTISSCPGNTTVQCLTQVPPINTGAVIAGDNCGDVAISWRSDVQSGTCVGANVLTVTRTYRAIDACGNTAECQQVITVDDTTVPEITCPANTTIECSASSDPSNTGTATAIDNCDPAPGVAHSDVVTPGNCAGNYSIARTWAATDACGNTATCMQTITVHDTTPPQITACPQGTTVQCLSNIPNPNIGLVTATDNCGSAVITYVGDVPSGPACNQTITRTYRATDACGNSSTCVQTITVRDTQSPVITCAQNVTIECDETPVFTDPTVTDNCDPSPVLNVVSTTSTPGPGAGEVTHTRCWTATDACGNTSLPCCQNIVKVGCGCIITGPDLVCPSSVNPFQLAGPPPPGTIGFVWTVAGSGTIVGPNNGPVAQVQAGSACGTSFLVILDVMGAAGPISHCEKSVQIDDTAPPQVDPLSNVNVQCSGDVPDPDPTSVSAIDNCGLVTVVFVGDQPNGQTCPELITRTYRASDPCGNHTDVTQTIRVWDTVPPTIMCPSDRTFECSSIGDFGVATASDNCDENLAITFNDTIVPGACPGSYQIRRQWTANDDCLNTASCLETITIVDTVPPTITCAADGRIGCSDPLIFTPPTAVDNCNRAPQVVVSQDTSVPGPNPGEMTYTRCWTASDGCGNAASCCQTIIRDACPLLPLEIDKTSSVTDCVSPGGTITYTLSYHNPNAIPVADVLVLEPVSPGLIVTDTHGGLYRPGPPPSVLWTIGTLAGLASGSVELDVQVDPSVAYGSVLYNECWIYWEAPGNHAGDNLSIDVCQYPYVPLRLTKTDNLTAPVAPGDTVRYEIRCYNDNDVEVTGGTIMDQMPADVSFVWATSPYTLDVPTHQVTWNLDPLPAHSSLLVHLWVKVNDGTPTGDLINTASVTSTQTPMPVVAAETTQVVANEIRVYVDVNPGDCPNVVNPKAEGVLRVAILGTRSLNVRDIDPPSIRLTAEGSSASLAPEKWSYEDGGTPYMGQLCGCSDQGPDGYLDLVLKFPDKGIGRLGLSLIKGQTVKVTLTGVLRNGTRFTGSDCIRVPGRDDEGSMSPSAAAAFEFGDQIGARGESQVSLAFYTAGADRVRIDIYDIHGRVVANLMDTDVGAGSHSVTWNFMSQSGQKVPVGIYFVRLSTSTENTTKKLVVVE